jgi:hypothetical protein
VRQFCIRVVSDKAGDEEAIGRILVGRAADNGGGLICTAVGRENRTRVANGRGPCLGHCRTPQEDLASAMSEEQ